jgi:GTPase SAR1 family protein
LSFFLSLKKTWTFFVEKMTVINVVVVGESGSGKTTVVNGLLSSANASRTVRTRQSHPVIEDDKDFWGSQRPGAQGRATAQYNGNEVQLDIAEVIGFRSRMGNSIISQQAAKKADVIVFCVAMDKNMEWRFYGLRRIRDQILQVSNKTAKLIVALTKTDLYTEPKDPNLSAVPSYLTPLRLNRTAASRNELLEEILTAHHTATPYYDHALKEKEKQEKEIQQNRQKMLKQQALKKKVAPKVDEKPLTLAAPEQTTKSNTNEEEVNSKKRKLEEPNSGGVLTRSAKKIYDLMATVPRSLIGATQSNGNNNIESKEIAPLA